jgi:hypothetical protein
MAELALSDEQLAKQKLEEEQSQAAKGAAFRSALSNENNRWTVGLGVAAAALVVFLPAAGVVAGVLGAGAAAKAVGTAIDANQAAGEARQAAESKFLKRQQAILDIKIQEAQLANLKNSNQQPARPQTQPQPVASETKKEKKEPVAQIFIPNPANANPEPTKQKRTTEVASAEPATPEQVSNAQAAVLENPLNITLGAAQQGADGKIVRSVLDFNTLLAQTKTNAQGIDIKMDTAMGNSPTEADVMRSLEKFTDVLTPNMQKRGISDNNKKSTEENQIRFAQAVQDSMLKAGAYTLTTTVTQGEHPNRTFAIESALPAGRIGRNLGNAANYAMNSVEPNFNNQKGLMDKATALSAIEKHPDFKTEGKFDAAKVADAFVKGEFKSFINNTDPQIQALAKAAEMVTNEYHYNKEQAKEQTTAEQTNEPVANEGEQVIQLEIDFDAAAKSEQTNDFANDGAGDVEPKTSEGQNLNAEWVGFAREQALATR